jgi:hypothetical protein
MKTTLAPLLATLLLAACAGDVVTPADLGIEVDLPRLRIEGTPGWRDEPELLVIQVGETVRVPSEAEIDATSNNAAFLLCAESGLDAWPAVTAAFRGAIHSERPRMYFAGLDSGSGLDAIAMVANRNLEDELRRVSSFLAPMDAGPEGAFELRITRSGDAVRYRWRRLGTDGPIHWDLGDVTLSAKEDFAAGGGTGIPALAKTLGERTTGNGAPGTLVAFELGQGVRPAHFLRALECGGGSTEVAFVPLMSLYPPIDVLRIDLPAPEDGVDGGVNEDGSGENWLVVNLGISALEGSPRLGQPEYRVRNVAYGDASEIPRPDPAPAGLYLRVDSEQPFRLCEPLVRWAAEKRIPIRFALAKKDPNFFRERSFEIPAGPGDAKKTLRVPAGATAGSVIRDAHRMVAGGATAIEFVIER